MEEFDEKRQKSIVNFITHGMNFYEAAIFKTEDKTSEDEDEDGESTRESATVRKEELDNEEDQTEDVKRYLEDLDNDSLNSQDT